MDIAKLLSQANRKSYRQGMSYDVASIVFHDSDSSETYIKVCTAPNTWPLQQAWKMGFDQWMLQQRGALRATGLDDFGPWHDFKVHINVDHVSDIDKPLLIDSEDNTFTAGEWIYSTYEIPIAGFTNPAESNILLMGPNAGTAYQYTSVSLMQELEYVLTVPTADPELPSTASDSLWAQMSPDQPDAEVLREVMASLEDDNDLPPYSPTIVPGAGTAGSGRPSDPWIARECCIQGGAHHMAAVGGFTVPCGLLVFETQQDGDDTIGVTLELTPGDYKGVSARPMRGGGR